MRDPINTFDHEGEKGHEGKSLVFKKIFTPENIWAFVLFLIVVALIVFTTNDSPNWIYQGF
jgi:hypothetical protein